MISTLALEHLTYCRNSVAFTRGPVSDTSASGMFIVWAGKDPGWAAGSAKRNGKPGPTAQKQKSWIQRLNGSEQSFLLQVCSLDPVPSFPSQAAFQKMNFHPGFYVYDPPPLFCQTLILKWYLSFVSVLSQSNRLILQICMVGVTFKSYLDKIFLVLLQLMSYLKDGNLEQGLNFSPFN